MNFDIEMLVEHLSQMGTVMLLESQSDDHPWSQKTYVAALPEAEIKARNHSVTVIQHGQKTTKSENPWKALRQFRKEQDDWLFGYLGYDLKNHLEKLESQNSDLIKAPDLYFMVPGFLLEIDRKSGRSKLLKGKIPDFQDASKKWNNDFSLENVHCQTSQEEYLAAIQKAQEHILEGDFYEINLSHQLKGSFQGNPFGLYQKMKQVGRVPFGAYLRTTDIAVCSQSPERFLRKKGTTVFSQPIKGTSQRGEDVTDDEAFKQHLKSSSKERAENLMIVDLVRNDLSRIARSGSVKVSDLFSVQSFGTVHQMVSTVEAQTEVEDPIEIIKACFPMGSMTGAPKISAMKSIEELEDYRRGIYSGAIGYISPDADFDFNVVIRTAIIRDDHLFYSVGGAITSDSDPLDEWHETEVKSRALLNVLAELFTKSYE